MESLSGHPIEGAELRVDRAREHLANIERMVDDFRLAHKDAGVFDFDVETLHASLRAPEMLQPPRRLSILIGEATYNLRAALDYLVYELARLDSDQDHAGTQFPIDVSEKVFSARRSGFLKGVNVEHRAAIELLQPYRGCEWTGRLRTLSNPDKHRHLGIVADEGESVVRSTRGEPGEFDGLPGAIYRAEWPDGEGDVHVEVDMSLEVTFGDGTPIVGTLGYLVTQVAETIQAFKPEFERASH